MKTSEKVRLSEEELSLIKETAKKIFGENVEIYIFGSRADISKKGGDIDIYIETKKNVSIKDELKFLAELELKGISRKVDLVVKAPNKKHKPIFDEAKKGVKI